MKVRDLLTDETKWTRRVYAQDRLGQRVDIGSPRAVRWCLVGALQRCYTAADWKQVYDRVDTHVGAVVIWNDAPERTFAEVRALVEELDI